MDGPSLEAFAEGVAVGPLGVGWWSGWFGGVGGWVDGSAVFVVEGEAVGLVGVAGDVEAAEVVVAVAAPAQGDEVVGVGGAVVAPLSELCRL